MKKLILIIVLLLNITCIAQEDKTVTLTVSGTGKTIEDAKNNALRSAIEQAFGAFISSKTEILNDNLVKDEVVSVANGNIQKFEIVSQVEIPNNGYAITLNATVSISKLTSFAQSKGVSIEVKGGLFAANIIQQELNEKAELISLQNILNSSSEILKKSFDYSIETKGNPTLNNGKYDIPLKISVKLNKNFYEFRKYFINSLSGLSMIETEIANYEEIKKPIGQLIIRRDTINFQENMLSKKFEFYGDYGKSRDYFIVDLKKFDGKNEKIFSFDNSQVNVINTLDELKSTYKRWKWYSNAPIIYKVNKEDLGYSKIFFRNKTSLQLLSDFFDNVKDLILNFETSNNVELIGGNDLFRVKKIKVNNSFNFILKNIDGYSYLKNIFNSYSNDEKNNFIDSNSQNTRFNQFIYSSENFTNLLSIIPIKNTTKIILASFSKFKKEDEITTIDYVDTKSLEEIKQLTEYKIRPKE